MDALPLVSVICLCYNQKSYVQEALTSVLTQTYPNIEIIVVDDASSDGSQEEIIHITNENPEISCVLLDQNVGNCKAFNMAFKKSRGKYIIDLAADDILLPVRVEVGVKDLETADAVYGVHFSDAFMIDQNGKALDTHYPRNRDGEMTMVVPQGDIYEDLIIRYFINPPTMMIKRKVLEDLNGYDETLAYEDFDFWIRSSRTHHYFFNKAPLVKKRIVQKSLSTRQSTYRNRHQHSTYKVCIKILELNQTKEENNALTSRCWYEIRQCIKTLNLNLIPKYLSLILKIRSKISS